MIDHFQIPKFPNFQIKKDMSKKVDFVKSINGMSEADLVAKISEDELRLKKLSFAHAIAPLENPQSIRFLRRDIARLKTALRKIQIGA
jgi:large subunit ribosomal protein L29